MYMWIITVCPQCKQAAINRPTPPPPPTYSQLFVGLIWQRIGRQAVGGGGTFAIYNWNWLNNIIN